MLLIHFGGKKERIVEDFKLWLEIKHGQYTIPLKKFVFLTNFLRGYSSLIHRVEKRLLLRSDMGYRMDLGEAETMTRTTRRLAM